MSAYEDCLTRICEILVPLTKQGHVIQEDTELVAELGLSSLQVMEVIERLEDDFDVSIPLNILPEVRSVRDLGVQLEQLTNSQQ